MFYCVCVLGCWIDRLLPICTISCRTWLRRTTLDSPPPITGRTQWRFYSRDQRASLYAVLSSKKEHTQTHKDTFCVCSNTGYTFSLLSVLEYNVGGWVLEQGRGWDIRDPMDHKCHKLHPEHNCLICPNQFNAVVKLNSIHCLFNWCLFLHWKKIIG